MKTNLTEHFKKFNDPFHWIDFNCLKALKPLKQDNLFLTTNSPRVPSTHLVDLARMKG